MIIAKTWSKSHESILRQEKYCFSEDVVSHRYYYLTVPQHNSTLKQTSADCQYSLIVCGVFNHQQHK